MMSFIAKIKIGILVRKETIKKVFVSISSRTKSAKFWKANAPYFIGAIFMVVFKADIFKQIEEYDDRITKQIIYEHSEMLKEIGAARTKDKVKSNHLTVETIHKFDL